MVEGQKGVEEGREGGREGPRDLRLLQNCN